MRRSSDCDYCEATIHWTRSSHSKIQEQFEGAEKDLCMKILHDGEDPEMRTRLPDPGIVTSCKQTMVPCICKSNSLSRRMPTATLAWMVSGREAEQHSQEKVKEDTEEEKKIKKRLRKSIKAGPPPLI